MKLTTILTLTLIAKISLTQQAFPMEICIKGTNVIVRKDNGETSGETVNTGYKAKIWAQAQMRGLDYVKLGYDRWVAKQFIVPASQCPKSEVTGSSALKNYKGKTVWGVNAGGKRVLACRSFLHIDADGSPHAYHPRGSPPGLDYLANAGRPGNWWGIVTRGGSPVVQGRGDPAPGYYISATALMDTSVSKYTPRAYANSETMAFIVIPGSSNSLGWRLGDFVTAKNFNNGKIAHGVVADIGPNNQFGEASMQMATQLGLSDSPKRGGASGNIGYVVYPGTSGRRPRALPTRGEIDRIGNELYAAHGGEAVFNWLRNK